MMKNQFVLILFSLILFGCSSEVPDELVGKYYERPFGKQVNSSYVDLKKDGTWEWIVSGGEKAAFGHCDVKHFGSWGGGSKGWSVVFSISGGSRSTYFDEEQNIYFHDNDNFYRINGYVKELDMGTDFYMTPAPVAKVEEIPRETSQGNSTAINQNETDMNQHLVGGEDYDIDSNDGSIAYIIDPPSNVRSCPNTSCDVVAECKTKNETVKIISVEGNWAMIETNSGARGYLHSSQYTQNTSGKVFTATVDKLRFRETPSFNGVVIREVSMGTTFTYLNEQTNMLETAKIAGQELPGYWYRVRAQDGREGWVHGCCISGI